ncbi:MAG: hypothetical protein ACF8PN_07325 [Phycisphaerales bacterium]
MRRFISYLSVLTLVAGAGAALAFGPDPKSPSADEEWSPTAQEAFEQMKELVGVWETTIDDKGSIARETFEVIAGGTTLVQRTEFLNDPSHTMLTMYHVHDDELVLKHYCVAGNQPEMKATKFAQNPRRITFTYSGATGMADRNEGHMDRAFFTFVDDDHFRDKWDWYEDGEVTWAHEFTYTRVEPQN